MRRVLEINGEKWKLMDSLNRFGGELFFVAEATKIFGTTEGLILGLMI